MKDPNNPAPKVRSSGGTGESTSGIEGLTVPLGVHIAELRIQDLRFDDERDRRLAEVASMNDRRLAEVAIEREKALKIKETADLAALSLAREIQDYKDEKATQLRDAAADRQKDIATRWSIAAVGFLVTGGYLLISQLS